MSDDPHRPTPGDRATGRTTPPVDDDPTSGDAEPVTTGDPTTGAEIEPARTAMPAAIDPSTLPVAKLPSAAPSRPARNLAFLSIVIGGLCGGLIGFAFTELQCTDGCPTAAGIGGIVGAVIGAAGVAVVAVLTLRAMDEWETIKSSGTKPPPRRKSRS